MRAVWYASQGARRWPGAERPIGPRAAMALLLVEGYCALAVEMIALRALVPVAGQSVAVTGIVVTAFLAALALGYRAGGGFEGDAMGEGGAEPRRGRRLVRALAVAAQASRSRSRRRGRSRRSRRSRCTRCSGSARWPGCSRKPWWSWSGARARRPRPARPAPRSPRAPSATSPGGLATALVVMQHVGVAGAVALVVGAPRGGGARGVGAARAGGCGPWGWWSWSRAPRTSPSNAAPTSSPPRTRTTRSRRTRAKRPHASRQRPEREPRGRRRHRPRLRRVDRGSGVRECRALQGTPGPGAGDRRGGIHLRPREARGGGRARVRRRGRAPRSGGRRRVPRARPPARALRGDGRQGVPAAPRRRRSTPSCSMRTPTARRSLRTC